MSTKTSATVALLLLTGLNFLNYIDRNVLFAVQPLIEKEFRLDDAQIGFLTSAFFVCYMCAAPLIAPLADRFSRKRIMAVGALIWSGATLLSAVTHNYHELLLRHAIVGIGEATFVAISPAFLADLFPENIRGRAMSIFYLAIPVGSALGFIVGGFLGHRYGWRAPFMICGAPGFLLGLGLLALREPKRGASDHLADTAQRGTLGGLVTNKAYWTLTLGGAMLTFAIGGLQVWMPTFLVRMRHLRLDTANTIFGGMAVVSGTVATLLGGWLGDRLLRKTPGSYQLVSAVGAALSIPAIVAAIYWSGPAMYPAIFFAEFFLLLNTAPLNTAVVNSVSARIRATALAVNVLTIHALGDAFSPTLIGYVSDRTNLQIGLTAMVVAVALATGVLLYGMRFAPKISTEPLAART
jgi:MFS transporter, Spinster family, sphingosine-1-phosphate transporter